jgi:histidyl-tRNA synthetase
VAKQFQHVRGTYDLLPDRYPQFRYVREVFERLTSEAGFGMIETPMMEDAAVFTRGVGVGTDIIDKEMYTLQDRGGDLLALRPEGTAGVVRAFIEHGMASLPKPVRLAYTGPMFRYERPQAGRFRQHQQVGLEVFGEQSPSIDAQVIGLAVRFYQTLGIHNVTVQINSLGDPADRKEYLGVLVSYLQQNEAKLAELDRERLAKNPLRVLDSKEASSQVVIAGAPQLLDHLSADSRQHFESVLEYLDTVGIRYEVTPRLVRGFDYATRTVYEFYGDREGSQSAIGGGCRYNQLMQDLGGPDVPGIGFGIGLERVLLELEQRGVKLPETEPVNVYVASLGEAARLVAYRLTERLLDAGVSAVGSVDKDSIGSQLTRASKLGVAYAIIIGQKEVQEDSVIVRNMESGVQEMISLGDISKELQRRFKVDRS